MKQVSLQAVLDRFVDPHAESVSAFVALYDYVRPARIDDGEAARANFAALREAMEHEPRYRDGLRAKLVDLFITHKQITFFSDSGILPNTGFFSELWRRLVVRVLPEAVDDASLKDCIGRVFHDPRDHLWLAAIPLEDSMAFWQSVDLDELRDHPGLHRTLDQMLEAVLVLSHRISAMGLEPELLRIHPSIEQFASPFLTQTTEVARFVDSYHRSLSDATIVPEDEKQALVLIEQCREILRKARRTAKTQGTSLSLTFLLARLWQSLERMEALLRVLAARFKPDQRDAALQNWAAFFRTAVRSENERNSVRRYLSQLGSLLALRVTDNAGRTGEHYITTDRAGYFDMWRSAMGAGFIVGFMALFKLFAAHLNLAPLNQAFVYSMNYSLGFMLVHMLHFTIATKQPAMTAAAIAATIGETRGKIRELDKLAELVIDVLRSQFAAICGNVLLAFPTALALGLGLSWMTGQPIISADKAHHLLHELSPIDSLAVFHAAIAGVCLFLSGLIAGYFDNAGVYRRIPQRIAQLRWLNKLLGAARTQRFAAFVDRNLGGLAGNFFFGIMLGSMGTLGFLLGLPLDIRHITFSSANFAFALVGLNFAVDAGTLIKTLVGIYLIGVANLGVSFALALWVALKARGVEFRQSGPLLGKVLRSFVYSPLRFFYPVRRAETEIQA